MMTSQVFFLLFCQHILKQFMEVPDSRPRKERKNDGGQGSGELVHAQ